MKGYTTARGIYVPGKFTIKGYTFIRTPSGAKVFYKGKPLSTHQSMASALYSKGFTLKDIPRKK